MTAAHHAARRNSLVYRCLTPDPAQAICFGNGRLGGSLHTPGDSLAILLSRSDLWNEQGGMGAVAVVRLRATPGTFTGAAAVRQEVDLLTATYRLHLATRGGPLTITVTALRQPDLVLVDIADGSSQPLPFSVTLENWHAGDLLECLPGHGPATLHLNQTSCFAAANRRVKVDAAALGVADPLLGRAWGAFVSAPAGSSPVPGVWTLPPAAHHRVAIAVLCLAPGTAAEPLAALRQQAGDLLARVPAEAPAWLAAHAAWWADFWARSYLALTSGSGDAEYEERLWYTNLYLLACACGGDYPPRFNGATFLLERDLRSWDYGYWFQNMREIYWPLFAAGHAHWARTFFQMYFDNLPYVRAQTRAIFGLDAPSFRETQTLWGNSPDTDLVAGKLNEAIQHNFSNNLEVCLLMDWYVQASGDEAFLRERLFPFLAEIMAFYLAYARRDEQGTWHLAPANALEIWPDCQDPMPDVAGLHYLVPRLIAWGERFGAAATQLAQWRDFAAHLPPVPVGRWTISSTFQEGIHAEQWHIASQADEQGIFLPAAAQTRDKMLRRNMENAELYLVFPWGLVHRDSPPAEVRRFELTWHHRSWRYLNNGWAQDVPQLARMGWAETARAASLTHASYQQRFPNGAFISPARGYFHGLVTDTPYLDTAGVHLTGLQEMLLQSFDGVVRLLPATSVEWSGRFALHALGGVRVEAAFHQGQPVVATFTATRATTLRLRNDRPEPLELTTPQGLLTIAPGTVGEVALAEGAVCQAVWTGVSVPAALGEGPRPEVVWLGWKLRPPPACNATGHWHDERDGHGQVGLAEDGRFPATRQPAGRR